MRRAPFLTAVVAISVVAILFHDGASESVLSVKKRVTIPVSDREDHIPFS